MEILLRLKSSARTLITKLKLLLNLAGNGKVNAESQIRKRRMQIKKIATDGDFPARIRDNKFNFFRLI